MKPLSVLYIHHCGIFGGASRSLLEMINAFPKDTVKPYILTQKGSTSEIFRKNGLEVNTCLGISQFDNSKYSYYRGLRWLILFRELCYLPFTFWAILKAKRRWKDIDIIHINEITLLPVLIILRFFFKAPVILHVRSVQRKTDESIRAKIIFKLIKFFNVKILICIDETVSQNIPEFMRKITVHNGLLLDMAVASEKRGNDQLTDYLIVGYVGNILKLKGILDLVKAVHICVKHEIPVKLKVLGIKNSKKKSNIFKWLLNKVGLIQDQTNEFFELIKNLNLEEHVELLSFTPKIEDFYKSIDILCFPSHLNAAGRPVFESAFFKVPSIVAINNPLPDSMIDKETGLSVRSKSPEDIANAIGYFYQNPTEISRMGENAYKLANQHYDIVVNAKKVLNLYKEIINN